MVLLVQIVNNVTAFVPAVIGTITRRKHVYVVELHCIRTLRPDPHRVNSRWMRANCFWFGARMYAVGKLSTRAQRTHAGLSIRLARILM